MAEGSQTGSPMGPREYFEESSLVQELSALEHRKQELRAKIDELDSILAMATRIDCDEGGVAFDRNEDTRQITFRAASASVSGQFEHLIKHPATVDVSVRWDADGELWRAVGIIRETGR